MTYRELQAVLDRTDIAVGAAEAHGWLCGALCARASAFDARQWLRELAPDAAGGAQNGAAGKALRAVHEETLTALHSPDFAFAPLVPGDDAALRDRVSALASWSSGFLYGIGTGGARRNIMEAGEVGEFLRDLANIARAELEPGRSAEVGESDFTELYEFVRAGVQLAWDELAGARTHETG